MSIKGESLACRGKSLIPEENPRRRKEGCAEYERCAHALLHALTAQRGTLSNHLVVGRPRALHPCGSQCRTRFAQRLQSMLARRMLQVRARSRCSSVHGRIRSAAITVRTSAVTRCIHANQVSTSLVDSSIFLFLPSMMRSIFICAVLSTSSRATVMTHEQHP